MRPIFLIRIALLLGVTTFAAVTVYLRASGKLPAPAAEATAKLAILRYAVWAVSGLALVWAFWWKQRAEAAMTEQGVHQALIIGWAPGEAAALLGAATHFAGGPVASLGFGMLAFVAVLLVLRIPAPSR